MTTPKTFGGLDHSLAEIEKAWKRIDRTPDPERFSREWYAAEILFWIAKARRVSSVDVKLYAVFRVGYLHGWGSLRHHVVTMNRFITRAKENNQKAGRARKGKKNERTAELRELIRTAVAKRPLSTLSQRARAATIARDLDLSEHTVRDHLRAIEKSALVK